MPLNRDQVTPPVLPEDIVPCPPAGGDVIVRGLLMTQRLANDRIHAEERALLDGLGEPYRRFAETRARLIPGVW